MVELSLHLAQLVGQVLPYVSILFVPGMHYNGLVKTEAFPHLNHGGCLLVQEACSHSDGETIP
jgi:hypothetical protein